MKTILLTGCAGFIGSHLCEALLNLNYKVIGIDNFDDFYKKEIKQKNLDLFINHKNFSFYELNICDFKDLNQLEENFDCVIHLAAKAGVLPSIKSPQSYIDVNIKGTSNVLEFIKQKRINKYIFTSSSSVYGNNKEIPFEEKQAVDFQISPYAFTKKSCELLNYNYSKLYNIDTINLRLFTVYGPRQRPDLAINKFIQLINTNQPIEMYGDGTSARDYTYVSDTVSGITAALNYVLNNKNVFETVNLGNNEAVQLKELIAAVYEVCAKEPHVIQKEMQAGDVNITYANIDKAKQLFGYTPKVKLKEGLKHFKTWFDEQ